MIDYSNINNDNQIFHSIPLRTVPYIVTNEISKEKISQNLPKFSKLTKGKKVKIIVPIARTYVL